ncbi:MAG TPA: hypothetical protein VF780_06660 [Nitrosospira sp.]
MTRSGVVFGPETTGPAILLAKKLARACSGAFIPVSSYSYPGIPFDCLIETGSSPEAPAGITLLS